MLCTVKWDWGLEGSAEAPKTHDPKETPSVMPPTQTGEDSGHEPGVLLFPFLGSGLTLPSRGKTAE
jgi:hypothetical protein